MPESVTTSTYYIYFYIQKSTLYCDRYHIWTDVYDIYIKNKMKILYNNNIILYNVLDYTSYER